MRLIAREEARTVRRLHRAGPDCDLEKWTMTKRRSVKDLMSPDIMTVADDMTTDALAEYFVEREISGRGRPGTSYRRSR